MLDKNLDVLEGSRPDGSLWYYDRRAKPQNVIPRQNEPVLPAGTPGFYTAAQAQKFGLCKRHLRTRQEVAAAYDLPDSSLREDPLEGRSPIAWRIDVHGALNRATEERVKRHVNRLIGREGVNFLIVQLDCAGGDPVVARELAEYLSTLRDTTGQYAIKTVAYVTPQARDHAVFLALACSEIVMDQHATLGDYERFLALRKSGDSTGADVAQALETLAKKRDYSPALARALVDRDLVVYRVKARANPTERRFLTEEELRDDQRGDKKWADPELVKEKGKFLVLSADQAVKFGFAQHSVDNVDGLFQRYGLLRQQVKADGPDWLDQFAQFLRRIEVTVIMVVLGFACLILEFKLPGSAVPGIMAALIFILFFWAHWELGLVWLAVLLFVLGLVLVALEIFVTPGLAVLGVSGVILMLAGLGAATMDHLPQTESEWVATVSVIGRFGLSLVGAVAVAVIVARYLPNIPYANRLMLVPPGERSEDAFDENAQVEAARRAGLLGAIGVAATTLRPSGMVRFGDEFLDVVAEGSYVEPGTRVQVIEIEGNRIVVKEV
jgi:membrane-bound ClpP family serine protease